MILFYKTELYIYFVLWIKSISILILSVVSGGDETRSGYVRYIQDIQPNIPVRLYVLRS